MPTADTSIRGVEAVIDEVALLEARLREASERAAQSPRALSGAGMEQVVSYACELKAWVEERVDSRLAHRLQVFAESLVASQQENANICAMIERLESEMGMAADAQSKLLSVVQGISSEMADMKASIAACRVSTLMEPLQSVMGEVDELKRSVAARELELQIDGCDARLSKHAADIEDLRMVRGECDQRIIEVKTEIRERVTDAMSSMDTANRRLLEDKDVEVRARSELLAKQLESKFAAWQQEVTAEVNRKLHGLVDATRSSAETAVRQSEERSCMKFDSWRADIESRFERHSDERTSVKLDSWRLDMESRLEMEISDVKQHLASELKLHGGQLDGLKAYIDTSQAKVGSELLVAQQKLVADLRTETTTAFRSEAAAVAALDEQLWLTDKRLGQRIDEISHLYLSDRVGRINDDPNHEPSSIKVPLTIAHKSAAHQPQDSGSHQLACESNTDAGVLSAASTSGSRRATTLFERHWPQHWPQACECGNEFLKDSLFCRKCGAKRSLQNGAVSSVFSVARAALSTADANRG